LSLRRFSLKWVLAKICLQIVPIQEKLIILGCQMLRVAWIPSKQLVCAFGDIFLMSFTIHWFRNIECNFSWVAVPPFLQQLYSRTWQILSVSVSLSSAETSFFAFSIQDAHFWGVGIIIKVPLSANCSTAGLWPESSLNAWNDRTSS